MRDKLVEHKSMAMSCQRYFRATNYVFVTSKKLTTRNARGEKLSSARKAN